MNRVFVIKDIFDYIKSFITYPCHTCNKQVCELGNEFIRIGPLLFCSEECLNHI
jgi:hypothetical protein